MDHSSLISFRPHKAWEVCFPFDLAQVSGQALFCGLIIDIKKLLMSFFEGKYGLGSLPHIKNICSRTGVN